MVGLDTLLLVLLVERNEEEMLGPYKQLRPAVRYSGHITS